MIVDVVASQDVDTKGGLAIPSCTGFAPDAFPEVQTSVLTENSNTGVSTRNALFRSEKHSPNHHHSGESHWYVLRTTYGRERKAYEYIIAHGGIAFHPTVSVVREINGKRTRVSESRLPNIFFAYGTEEEIKSFVYDNVNLPFLRFYYRHFHSGSQVEKEPMIVPDRQMDNLRLICRTDAEDIVVSAGEVEKFQSGQHVRITEGKFKGITGIVARYMGQQRVGIVIDGLLTVATAYIPSAFVEKVEI